jgi:RES domain-containing protein
MRAFRIVSSQRPDPVEALSGEGARLYGGRWNHPGTRLVYTASTASLALLEMAVHLPRLRFAREFILFELEFPDELGETLTREALPDAWDAYPFSATTQDIGDAWIASARSLALVVPSAVLPFGEPNILLNPAHPAFAAQVQVVDQHPFQPDPRVKA